MVHMTTDPILARIAREERRLTAMRAHPAYRGGNPAALILAEETEARIAALSRDAIGIS